MIKKILPWIINLLLLATVNAEELNSDNTTVILTNNTPVVLQLKINLLTEDKAFQKGKDWDGNSLLLAPYETKSILWFNRNIHVKSDQLYQFDIVIEHPNYHHQDLIISVTEKGKKIYGSDIYANLTLPLQIKRNILVNNHFQLIAADFWNNSYQIYARQWTPLTSLVGHYHFTINQPQTSIFNTSSAKRISILSYNTQFMPFYANVINNLNQPDIRVTDIPPKISSYDVVILEELFDKDLRLKIIKLMQVHYPFHTEVVGDHTTKALTGGIMMFSKWPIIKQDQIIYQASADIDSLAAKGVIYAAINKMGIIYHVFGTHLQAAEVNGGHDARQKQLLELANWIENLNIPPHQAVLIGGDFNIHYLSPDFIVLQNTLHVKLLDNIGYPYSTDSDINTMSKGQHRSRIDYIFYSNLHLTAKIAYNKIFILRDLENVKMWPSFDLSDHFPVVGFFDFNE